MVSQRYDISGTKAGWVITPDPLSSGVITGDTWVGDLSAEANAVTISGVVYNVDGTTPLTGVSVSCAVTGSTTRTLATGTDGKYSFSVHPDSIYLITPVLSGYAFNPANRNYTNHCKKLSIG